MSEEIKKMRNEGMSWRQITKELDITLHKARSLYNAEPEFPKYLDGVIVKQVLNPRLILVRVDGENKPKPAIIRQGFNYPSGKKVKLEQIDEKHLRVV